MSTMVLDGASPRSQRFNSSLNRVSKGPYVTARSRDLRFAKIIRSGDCWVWTGALNKFGYGKVSVPGKTSMPVHRWVYEQLVGPIPEGLTLDHLCRVPACVAPYHLEPVTQAENTRRAQAAMMRGAHREVCKHGHAMTRENLVMRESRHGSVVHECRQCIRDQNKRKYRKSRGGVVGLPNSEKTHCKRGHIFDEANTYINKQGARRCRACGAESQRRTTQKRKAGLI